MASSCTSSPTQTLVTLFTSTSLSTTFTTTTTVIDGQGGEAQTTCRTASPTGSGTPIVSCATVTGRSAPQTSVITVPVVTEIPIVQTSQTTLYGTSCRAVDGGGERGGNHDPATVTTTPPPTVVTTQTVTTLPDGQIATSYIVTTTTPPPVVTSNPNSNSNSNGTQSKGNSNLGAIIGGAVGGILGLVLIILGIWYILKRRRKWDDIFDDINASATPTVTESKPTMSRPASYLPPSTHATSPPMSPAPPSPQPMDQAPMNQGYMTYNSSAPAAHSGKMDAAYAMAGMGAAGALSPHHHPYSNSGMYQQGGPSSGPPMNRPPSDYFQGGYAHSQAPSQGGSSIGRPLSPMSSASGTGSGAHLMGHGSHTAQSASSVSGTSASGTRGEKAGGFAVHNQVDENGVGTSAQGGAPPPPAYTE
ncbi:hypothetical protein PM082_020960 [Marasmius tenuissimus]|nr:hypothetical protein PM082_020960 [Marasmius tenuissimus]